MKFNPLVWEMLVFALWEGNDSALRAMEEYAAACNGKLVIKEGVDAYPQTRSFATYYEFVPQEPQS